MTTTILHGTLGADTDTFFIVAPRGLTLVDASFAIDTALLGTIVSASGRMGSPPSAPGLEKLLVERLVSNDAISRRAFELFASGAPGSQDDHWFRAERELLGL